MAFDLEGFKSARFSPREESVPVPSMAGFFGDGEALWRIRGLEGKELGRANAAAERNRNVKAIIEGLLSEKAGDKARALCRELGLGDETPQDIAVRLYHLVAGSVDPAVDEAAALQLCKAYPVVFFDLTNRILRLTHQGHVPGK